MTRTILLAAVAIAAATGGPALAQVNQPTIGTSCAEDGYNDDGFGWGPAYRPETSFRPEYGFYGGVERRNPCLPEATGSLTPPEPGLSRPRAIASRPFHRRTARRASRQVSRGIAR